MIIRAYQLKRWDIFKKQGVIYLVRRVTDKEIIYTWWKKDCSSGSGTFGSIGIKSQERVEYVGTRIKKKETETDFSLLSNYNFYLCESLTEIQNQKERA